MKFKLKGSSSGQAVSIPSRPATVAERVLDCIARSTQPLNVKDLTLLVPGVTQANISTTLGNLRSRGLISNIEGDRRSTLASYILAPPKPKTSPPKPLGMAIANCVSKMDGFYRPPAWESVRPGADNFLRHQSKGF
jgi:hypothetical protein